MEGVLEAPVPVRFVFFLMGPSHSGMDYHESGRADGVADGWLGKEELWTGHWNVIELIK